MHLQRTHVLVTAVPVAAYLGVLALTALYVKPPLIGWIGFAIVTVVALAITVGAIVLFPRISANVGPASPQQADGLLVVADATCSSDRLRAVVVARAKAHAVPVHVVAPVLASPAHYLSDDERRGRDEAIVRLDATLADLARAGIAARGSVGADDPLQAVGDALALFPAGEVVIVTGRESHWLEGDLIERVGDLVGTVEHVVAEPAAAC